MTDQFLSQEIPKILIVDDAPANLELLAEILRKRGYEPRPVLNGDLALMSSQADPPDLILLDIRMPEMDGFEVCRRLKADETLKKIPVIFITALTETAEKVKAFSMGAVDYITKPFQAEEIGARVEAHLKIRLLQRQLQIQNENLEQIVVEKTRELAVAYQRLLELDRLKSDFLRMISHEIRTPVNGVLGIGELLLNLCPSSEQNTLYHDLFTASCLRLRKLIDDATLIASIEIFPPQTISVISFSGLLKQIQTFLPNIRVSLQQADLESVFLHGDEALLKRALENIFLLAASFSQNKQRVEISGWVEAGFLHVQINLDALFLSDQAAASFFDIESSVRSASSAEALGLAPVVANKIISALGGKMGLIKETESSGHLEAILVTVPS